MHGDVVGAGVEVGVDPAFDVVGGAVRDEGVSAAAFLAAGRLAGEAALVARLSRAVDEGDLPPGTDPVALGRFVMVVSEGNAVHAAAGVDRAALHATVDFALTAIPRSARPAPR